MFGRTSEEMSFQIRESGALVVNAIQIALVPFNVEDRYLWYTVLSRQLIINRVIYVARTIGRDL